MDSNVMTVAERRGGERKKRLTALILSLFFPGLGQLVTGRLGIGITALIFDAGFVLFPWLMVKIVVIQNEHTSLTLLIWLLWAVSFAIYYLLVAYDAYCGTRLQKAPCRRDCPADINVPDYIALVAAARHAEADELVRERAPLAGTLGRICPAPCEKVCTRTRIDDPLAIRSLKRSAQEHPPVLSVSKVRHSHKVAVVGAGPSGLTCAHFLARRGYAVDLMDRAAKPGGLLRTAIPEFRLPRKVIDEDIGFIFNSNPGITLMQKHMGKDITLDDLEASYDAVYLGIGLAKPRKLDIPGEDLAGVVPGLSFLCDVHDAATCPTFFGHAAVFGGGDVAMDAARLVRRLGAERVTIYYRRRAEDMPANPSEVEEAKAEGIKYEFLVAPVVFTGKDRVEEITLTRLCLVDPEKGRASGLKADCGEEWKEKVETVIVAVGQSPDSKLIERLNLATNPQGRLKVNRRLQTSRRKVFAGGDVTGTEAEPTVVEAIGEGRKAAQAIDYFLRPRFGGRFFERMGDFDPDFKVEKLEDAAWRTGKPPLKSRFNETCDHEKIDFRTEAMCGLAQGDDVEEAKRCLRCQRYNIGFAFKKGKQKGYVKLDKR